MKKTSIFLTALFVCQTVFSYASDVLTLTNNKSFSGSVVKIKECVVVFKAENGIRYEVPASDIQTLQFENVNNKIYTQYVKNQDNVDNCLKGTADAKSFHGKGGLHFALGVLFGPFAVIGSAVGNPEPLNGARTQEKSKNSSLFEDPTYLECYKRAARGKNVGMALAGWGTWILFLLL